MWKNVKKGLFPFMIAFSALSVSASAAFYSVYGLSKLFAGAQVEVIIMAGSLEVAKLVIASLLYQYWDTINKILRTYLTIAAVILVLITSMGIYGFLSAAYQETYANLLVNENKIEFLDEKSKFYEDDLQRYDKELEQISNNISILSNAKASSIQVRDTTVSGGVRSTISTAELRLSQARIEVEEENRKSVQEKRQVAADSLQSIKLEILTLNNDSETVGELGPLKYLSGLTSTPMDVIINILLLVIIFVFDPLAIALVVAANFAFAHAYPKKEENLYGELEEPDTRDIFPDDYDEDRMNIIGQNGNDGEHYEEVEPTEQAVKDYVEKTELNPFKKEEDWIVVDEEKKDPYADYETLKQDFDVNYAKYMIIKEDGTRVFLKEKPKFSRNPDAVEVEFSDGKIGKISRENDERIIYL
jgi:hypothetical protein